MGGKFSLLFGCYDFFLSRKKVIICGIEFSGKTSILYKLKLSEFVQANPTLGFNVEDLDYQGLSLKLWDLGGKEKERLLNHRNIGTNSFAMIYVLDSIEKNEDLIEKTRKEFQLLVNEIIPFDSKILIFANKQDLENSMNEQEIIKNLELEKVTQDWYIQKCSAKTNEGLLEGLDWLHKKIKE